MIKVYSDTMFSDTTLVLGNTCAQIHMTLEGYASGDPMKSKVGAPLPLKKFCREDGTPHVLITDRAKKGLYSDLRRL